MLNDESVGNLVPMEGVDWNNDKLFYTHSWVDETSQFDTHPSVRWNFGCEVYERKYKCRMPIAFGESIELQDAFIELMDSQFPDADGYWVD